MQKLSVNHKGCDLGVAEASPRHPPYAKKLVQNPYGKLKWFHLEWTIHGKMYPFVTEYKKTVIYNGKCQHIVASSTV